VYPSDEARRGGAASLRQLRLAMFRRARRASRRILFDEQAVPKPGPAYERAVSLGCTSFRVAAVRVTLDARMVPGWNEIDAIGLRSCDS
jgi:hypothetical protein